MFYGLACDRELGEIPVPAIDSVRTLVVGG